MKRQFTAVAPSQLWVTDLMFVPTWSGVAYVCFIVDAYSRTDRRLASGTAHWELDGPRCTEDFAHGHSEIDCRA